MFTRSIGGVIYKAAQPTALSSFAASARRPRAATAFRFAYPDYAPQRRHSSSKPSNGSSAKSASSSSSPKHPASDKDSSELAAQTKAPGEKRKRKVREAKNRLPSVPSTQHMSQEVLALTSFFSLHRPISVTHGLPRVVSDDVFASIFVPATRAQRMNNVISTLSRSVNEVEQQGSKLELAGQAEHEPATASDGAITKIEIRHGDDPLSNIYLHSSPNMSYFIPFRPPPAPEPTPAEGVDAGADEVEEVPQVRVFKAIITIEEATDNAGNVKFSAHSPRLVEEAPEPARPRTFLERMAQRHMRWEMAQQHRTSETDMEAISVRRQKKLKMKKKKYKKLMRKTRNARRKLDRL